MMAERDPSHPWAGHPRTFRAVAMPNGDARFGVAGPLVFLCEQRGGCVDRPKYLSRAEAEQLRDELNAALAAPDLARQLSQDIAAAIAERPRAYTGPYPIRGATLAEVGFA
jgi:hypothetical protein